METQSYCIDDSIKHQIKDTLEHKKIVMDSAYKMAEYLFEQGKNDLGIEIIDRAIIHDNSKFSKEELYALSSISSSEALTDPNVLLSSDQQKLVEKHWKNNRHHPEYFSSINNMSEIDIIEMCCDWHSRSVQFGTDLVEFAKVRQANRFHFPEAMFEKILFYCNVLIS